MTVRALVSTLCFSVLATQFAPASAAVSPFPPIDIGEYPVGTAGQYDFVLPLTIPFSSVPAAFDGIVLYTAPDAPTEAALNLLGFTSPVTVGQVKTLMPSAAAVIGAPTVAFSTSTGGFTFTDLGCTATECTYRFAYALLAPGTYSGHIEVTPPSVSILNGGLLGTMLSLLYPLLQNFLGSYLVFDVEVTALAPPGVPVPAIDTGGLLALILALAALGAVARRRRQRRQASGR